MTCPRVPQEASTIVRASRNVSNAASRAAAAAAFAALSPAEQHAVVRQVQDALRSLPRAAAEDIDKSLPGNHKPRTGSHSHAHAAYGAEGENVGQHTHLHEHDDDAFHGHDHPAIEQALKQGEDAKRKSRQSEARGRPRIMNAARPRSTAEDAAWTALVETAAQLQWRSR